MEEKTDLVTSSACMLGLYTAVITGGTFIVKTVHMRNLEIEKKNKYFPL